MAKVLHGPYRSSTEKIVQDRAVKVDALFIPTIYVEYADLTGYDMDGYEDLDGRFLYNSWNQSLYLRFNGQWIFFSSGVIPPTDFIANGLTTSAGIQLTTSSGKALILSI